MTIAVQTVGLAFWLGGISARIRHVENKPAPPSNDDCAVQLAVMNATLASMDKGNERRFAELEHTVRNLLQGRVQPRRKVTE